MSKFAYQYKPIASCDRYFSNVISATFWQCSRQATLCRKNFGTMIAPFSSRSSALFPRLTIRGSKGLYVRGCLARRTFRRKTGPRSSRKAAWEYDKRATRGVVCKQVLGGTHCKAPTTIPPAPQLVAVVAIAKPTHFPTHSCAPTVPFYRSHTPTTWIRVVSLLSSPPSAQVLELW